MPKPTTIKKRKVSLDLFEEAVLPNLQEKFAELKDLQKAIDDNYAIYEEDDKGKETPVQYSVRKGKSVTDDAGDDDDDADDDAGDDDASGLTARQAKMVASIVSDVVKGLRGDMQVKGAGSGNPLGHTIEVKSLEIPEGIKLYKKVTSFTGTEEEKKFKAFRFGAMILGGLYGNQKYIDWCEDHGIPLQSARHEEDGKKLTLGRKVVKTAQAESSNPLGGILVPIEIDNDMIDLREAYGVFRANARIRPMSRDTLMVPRRSTGLTAYFTAEGASITESNKTWDSIQLIAKKLAALARYSSELDSDAIISIADDLAQEIFYAMGYKEDQCGFAGDGTSTYGSIVGVSNALTALFTSTTTSSAGVVIASGNAMSEVTDNDLTEVMGNLPEYADDGNAAWYCSRFAAFKIFGRLLRASGGITPQMAAGAMPMMYGNYPIRITQVMPRTDVNSQVLAIFGNLKKSSDFGDRKETVISFSDQAYWANDQTGIKGTERFDINNHDVGDGTNAGPMIGLRAAAS